MWDRTDQIIQGKYLGIPFCGIVRRSRVKYGGRVQHAVDLFEEIEIVGVLRDSILIEETDEFSVTYEDFRDCAV